MTQLISCLSTGKGTWGHVSRLIEDGKWDSVVLITNDYGKENFNKNEKTELISVNLDQGLRELREELKKHLKTRIKGTEVAVNFISGTGKEHMALVSALLQLGVGIRLMALTKDGIEEI
ncbi:MAG TPA: hypothetical protein VJB94_02575 [Candidatus Nanoarchaeia archaeon]|nr:hypothetical protein [Candidatus Nanoarchaeia archaeon]